MASEKEIQKQNLEAELATIRSEIDIEASKLSDILIQKTASEQGSKELESAKIAFEAYRNDTQKEIDSQKKLLVDSKARSDDEIGLNNTILKKIKDDIKESIKQLGWLNEKIMNADAVIISITAEKNRLDIEVADLLVLVSHKEDEQTKLTNLQNSRGAIESEINSKRRDCQDDINKISIDIKKEKEELLSTIKERDRVQNELKSYTDQLYTAMNDYNTIRTRLEVRFKEHYPELELPLMN